MERKPIVHQIIQKYLIETDIYNITEQGLHPCNILFPEIFVNNTQNMKYLLDDNLIDYKIYFANKATKADIFIETAKKQGI